MYKTIESADYTYLQQIISPERVLIGSEISEDYAHDELGGIHSAPQMLVKVQTTEEISQIMAYANEKHIPVTVRGSGTGLVGACVPLYGGILLETTGMNKILELDKDNLTVTVQPGVLLMELARFAEDNSFAAGLYFHHPFLHLKIRLGGKGISGGSQYRKRHKISRLYEDVCQMDIAPCHSCLVGA